MKTHSFHFSQTFSNCKHFSSRNFFFFYTNDSNKEKLQGKMLMHHEIFSYLFIGIHATDKSFISK